MAVHHNRPSLMATLYRSACALVAALLVIALTPARTLNVTPAGLYTATPGAELYLYIGRLV